MDRRTTALVVACVVTGVAAIGGHSLRGGAPEPAERVRLDLVPYEVSGWVGQDLSVSARVLDALGSDSLLLREYRAGEAPVWVYVDYHRRPRIGAQIHSPLNCYAGSGWTILAQEDTELASGGVTRPARWLRLRRGDREMVALYWYASRWGRSSRETALKTGMVRSALSRRPADAALLRFSTPVGPGGDAEARQRLARFLDAGIGPLEAELPFRAGTS